jgi:hypothetical protein
MALRLHAVVPIEGQHERDGGAGASLHVVRDIGALTTEQPAFLLDAVPESGLDDHRRIVDWAFRRGAVLPAPHGVLFRSIEVLTRWMELHYVPLTDAIGFVEDRVAARVHIVRREAARGDAEAGSDLAAAAAESFRALRRRAVAAVPLRLEEVTGLVLSTAVLVERDLWGEFESAVRDQQDAHDLLRFNVTGPWAPYDFVHMQFGG